MTVGKEPDMKTSDIESGTLFVNEKNFIGKREKENNFCNFDNRKTGLVIREEKNLADFLLRILINFRHIFF